MRNVSAANCATRVGSGPGLRPAPFRWPPDRLSHGGRLDRRYGLKDGPLSPPAVARNHPAKPLANVNGQRGAYENGMQGDENSQGEEHIFHGAAPVGSRVRKRPPDAAGSSTRFEFQGRGRSWRKAAANTSFCGTLARIRCRYIRYFCAAAHSRAGYLGNSHQRSTRLGWPNLIAYREIGLVERRRLFHAARWNGHPRISAERPCHRGVGQIGRAHV